MRSWDKYCEDTEKAFDPRQAGFKLMLEYFMLTPE